MAPNTDNYHSGLAKVKEYWPLIVALAIIVSTWATIGLRLDALEVQADKTEIRIQTVDDRTTTIQVALRGIDSDLQWIKLALEELKRQ